MCIRDRADTVARYNELCAAGRDEDFGKAAKYLVPIEGGPYYAIPRGSNKLPAILGGLVVDSNHQCLNGEFEPISGLYAVGNASGQFFGGVDYPMDIEGLSLSLIHISLFPSVWLAKCGFRDGRPSARRPPSFGGVALCANLRVPSPTTRGISTSCLRWRAKLRTLLAEMA